MGLALWKPELLGNNMAGAYKGGFSGRGTLKDQQDGSQGGRDGSREQQSLYLTGSTWQLPNLGSEVAFEAIQLFEEGEVTVLQR